MGRAKEAMFENEANADLINFLKVLLEQDGLTGAIQGIAKFAVANGVKAMSEKQKNAIDSFVENYKSKYECEVCLNGNVSSLTDYVFLSENTLCPMCDADREKFMSED